MTHTEAMERLRVLWQEYAEPDCNDGDSAGPNPDADALALAIRWGALLAEVAACRQPPTIAAVYERLRLPPDLWARVQDAVKS